MFALSHLKLANFDFRVAKLIKTFISSSAGLYILCLTFKQQRPVQHMQATGIVIAFRL